QLDVRERKRNGRELSASPQSLERFAKALDLPCRRIDPRAFGLEELDEALRRVPPLRSDLDRTGERADRFRQVAATSARRAQEIERERVCLVELDRALERPHGAVEILDLEERLPKVLPGRGARRGMTRRAPIVLERFAPPSRLIEQPTEPVVGRRRGRRLGERFLVGRARALRIALEEEHVPEIREDRRTKRFRARRNGERAPKRLLRAGVVVRAIEKDTESVER